MSTTKTAYDFVILAGDIGGTNTNLALIGAKGGSFTLLFDRHYRTQEEPSLLEPLGRFLAEASRERPGLAPSLCCVSGAGPVVEGRIELTNAPWGIDQRELEAATRLPVRVINDFTAVSYGVILLDPADPEEITPIPRPDGSRPAPDSGPRLVLGAGTGLGAGYVLRVRDRVEAFPSEGGHLTLPAFDEDTRAFSSWLEGRYGFVPGAEAAVSGQGIANLFAFLAGRPGAVLGPEARAVLGLPESERPARIAKAAGADPTCAEAMGMFVDLYARVASDLAAAFIPTGGLYLAGGIAAKNEALLLGGHRFRRLFERSYRSHITSIMERVPLMIVKDYDVSLYGAANAALALA